MSSRALRALAAAAGLASCAASAPAVITLNNGDTVPLTQILNSNDRQVQINDKLFTFVAYTSAQFPAAGLSITAFVAPVPTQGIGFDIVGGFGDTPGDTTISEFNLRYTVEVLPAFIAQGYRIYDSELAFDGAANVPGSYSRVDESILNFFGQPGQNLIANSSVYAYGSGTPLPYRQDRQVFGPPGYTKLELDKDVQFFANGADGSSSASFVRQSFSQIVPAPGSICIVGIGALIAARRKRP